MIYTCGKCGYKTKQKSHFDKHINKINPCSNEVVVFDKNSWDKTNANKKISELKSVEELNLLPKDDLIKIIMHLTEQII